MNTQKIFTLWKGFPTPDPAPRPHHAPRVLLFCALLLLGAGLAFPAPCRAWEECVYANPKYSVYNRLLSADVIRGDRKVAELFFSFHFNGYYVRCLNGGMGTQRHFSMARDARWAACSHCR